MSLGTVRPLRQRMIEDMTIRQLGEKTQHDYVRVVRDFAAFLGRSPDLAEPEGLLSPAHRLNPHSYQTPGSPPAVSSPEGFRTPTPGRPQPTALGRHPKPSTQAEVGFRPESRHSRPPPNGNDRPMRRACFGLSQFYV